MSTGIRISKEFKSWLESKQQTKLGNYTLQKKETIENTIINLLSYENKISYMTFKKLSK